MNLVFQTALSAHTTCEYFRDSYIWDPVLNGNEELCDISVSNNLDSGIFDFVSTKSMHRYISKLHRFERLGSDNKVECMFSAVSVHTNPVKNLIIHLNAFVDGAGCDIVTIAPI